MSYIDTNGWNVLSAAGAECSYNKNPKTFLDAPDQTILRMRREDCQISGLGNAQGADLWGGPCSIAFPGLSKFKLSSSQVNGYYPKVIRAF